MALATCQRILAKVAMYNIERHLQIGMKVCVVRCELSLNNARGHSPDKRSGLEPVLARNRNYSHLMSSSMQQNSRLSFSLLHIPVRRIPVHRFLYYTFPFAELPILEIPVRTKHYLGKIPVRARVQF